MSLHRLCFMVTQKRMRVYHLYRLLYYLPDSTLSDLLETNER